MKKLLFMLSAGCFLFITSCNSKKESGGLSDIAKKNLEAMHGITKCFDSKDFSKLGDYIAEDGIDHSGEQGAIKGLANMKTAFTKMVAAYDSSATEVTKELADDEYVMTWQRYKGTLKIDQMGMKAGDKFDMAAIEVAKFKDGKAIEHWTFMEPSEMMKMIGAPPPPMNDKMGPPVKDSASK
jgi:predicted ester cyclase